ncbi:MAG: hypothetical protein CV045_06015 [Cyanobacteria bacterium M5B4]|nr:MAG: hypothetical protein CV045_06015 [Cyanobacteria bacterium M5B4]
MEEVKSILDKGFNISRTIELKLLVFSYPELKIDSNIIRTYVAFSETLSPKIDLERCKLLELTSVF